jgi:phosphate transport system protein
MEWREKYRIELEQLRGKVHTMGRMTVAQLQAGLQAVETGDSALAEKVIADDSAVDALQADIEDLAAKLIAMEQPVAQDLREIVSTIKIVSSIERIADHAKHLAKGAMRIQGAPAKAFLPTIRNMAERGIIMLRKGLEAFESADASLAEEVAALDSEIDAMKKELTARIFAFMKSSPENIEEGAALLFLNRFMERLGDHVTNLCEWVYFTKTGNHIELN